MRPELACQTRKTLIQTRTLLFAGGSGLLENNRDARPPCVVVELLVAHSPANDQEHQDPDHQQDEPFAKSFIASLSCLLSPRKRNLVLSKSNAV